MPLAAILFLHARTLKTGGCFYAKLSQASIITIIRSCELNHTPN